MNCIEFRERRGAEPRRRDPALAEHEAGCAACARYAGEARALDDLVRAALEIPVPPPVRAAERRDFRQRRGIAMAASLVFAAVTGVLLYLAAVDPHRTLARGVTSHLEGEAAAVAAMQASVDADTVQSTLSRFDVRVAEDIGPVLDVRICIVGGKEVVHLVVERSSGPVTVMLIPEGRLERPVRIDAGTVAGRLSGWIFASGPGSVAIVGHGQAVDPAVEEQLARSIDWEDA